MLFNLCLESLFQNLLEMIFGNYLRLEHRPSGIKCSFTTQESLKNVEKGTGGRRWFSYADKWLEIRQDVSRYVLFKLDDSWSAERTRYPSLQFQRPFSPNLTIGHIPQPLLVISIQIPPLIFCRILRGNLQIPTVHQMQFSWLNSPVKIQSCSMPRFLFPKMNCMITEPRQLVRVVIIVIIYSFFPHCSISQFMIS